MIDDDDSSEWDEYQAKHEMRFIDLIECDDWYLVSDGKKQRVLIPNFGTDEEVVWTWDFSNDRLRSPSQDL